MMRLYTRRKITWYKDFVLFFRALALNCDAPLDDKIGAESRNWRAGKPVRVIRSFKGRKISKYAPEEGNRYDGIYKVLYLAWHLVSHSSWAFNERVVSGNYSTVGGAKRNRPLQSLFLLFSENVTDASKRSPNFCTLLLNFTWNSSSQS